MIGRSESRDGWRAIIAFLQRNPNRDDYLRRASGVFRLRMEEGGRGGEGTAYKGKD